MIVVDIYVPSLDQYYDFMVDENAKIHQLIDEMCEIFSQKTKCPETMQPDQFILCSSYTQAILPGEMTLAQCQVRDGSTLILV